MKRGAIIGWVVACVVLIGIGWGVGRFTKAGHSPGDALESSGRPVKYMDVAPSARVITRAFPGMVKPAREIKLAFRVGGPLVEMNGVTGAKVNKGDVIARIDPRDYQNRIGRLEAALQEANAGLSAMRRGARPEDVALLEAEVKAARAQFQEVSNNYDRYHLLYRENAVAKATYDSARAAFDMAEAKAQAAEKALEKGRKGARKEDIAAMEAKINGLRAEMKIAVDALADTRLTSPLNGVIDKVIFENFETVAPGMPVVTLLDFSHIEVGTTVNETVVIDQDRITSFHCRLEAYPDQLLAATLKELGRKPMGNHQSYPLSITLTLSPEMVVEPGMAATVIITLADQDVQNSVKVPSAALFYDTTGQACVWRIDPDTQSVEKQPVKPGEVFGSEITILVGLAADQRIVTAGARFLKEGQPVRLLEMD